MTTTTRTAVLAVNGNASELEMLRAQFTGSNWELRMCRSLAEGIESLKYDPPPVVLCERSLPDGDWKRLLRIINRLNQPPAMIVTSRHADEALWAEALDLGAFDVLPLPEKTSNVFRILGSAWRHWNEARTHTSKPLKSVPACAA
jgi:DNA-binding NtrC family response regulator